MPADIGPVIDFFKKSSFKCSIRLNRDYDVKKKNNDHFVSPFLQTEAKTYLFTYER